jgi:hypothetical protein
LLAYLLLASSMLTVGHNWGDDFSAYIMQAASLIEGSVSQYILQNSFTITHSSVIFGPILYPWGYPLLLAPVYAVFGLNLLAFKTLNLLLYLAFLICIYFLFAGHLVPVERLALVGLFAFNPTLLRFLDNILSDIPFLFFATLAILLIDRAVIRNQKLFSPSLDAVILGTTIFATYLIRANGVILLATLIICQIYQTWRTNGKLRIQLRRFNLTALLPYGIFIGLFAISLFALHREDTQYFSQLGLINPILVLKHIVRYTLLPSLFWHMGELKSPFNYFLTILLTPLLLLGLWEKRRKDYLFILYAGMTTLTFIIWPVFQGLRFIFSVLPFYVYFTYIGLKWLAVRIIKHPRFVTLIPYAVALVITVIFLGNSISLGIQNINAHRQVAGPFDQPSTEMFHYIIDHTEQNSTIVFFKPRVLRLITHRNTFYTNDCPKYRLADYLVLYKKTDIASIGLEDLARCNLTVTFQSIFSNQQYEIYRISE